ncbi:MAG TPA: LptF/LptG family permease [Rectinemataceae bacterium]|nr:LptF/LptG family permease [Rectinemataceae bacterium]
MRRATTLRIHLLRTFLPALGAALVLFALILELVDLFANLWRYLALGTPLLSIVSVMLLYLPAAISSALPISLLFATAFSLGNLYADNELTIVFGSGISLAQFMAPLFLIAGLLCIGSFFFDDRVVLQTLREKNQLSSILLRQKPSLSNADVAVISSGGSVVYRVDYYDDQAKVISGVTVLKRSSDGNPTERVEAATARWDGSRWVFGGVRRFSLKPGGGWGEESFGSWIEADLDEPPDAFRSQNLNLEEMSQSDLVGYVAFLRRAGLPYAAALAERHKRFSFAFTPLVVILLAAAVGGRYRKNVLLMSLLASLLAATGYYVAQMVFMLMAKTGVIDPRAGAWAPLLIFGASGYWLFRKART